MNIERHDYELRIPKGSIGKLLELVQLNLAKLPDTRSIMFLNSR